ncbi:hypothetical protein BH24ACT5_BH24ACT5_05830 [soil metagenome]
MSEIDRRRFLQVTGLGAAGIGLVNGLWSGTQALATSATGDLEMWSWNGAGAYPEIHQAARARWEAAAEANGLRVTYTDFGQYVTRLKTALAGGVPPDLVQMPWAGEYHDIIDANQLLALDDVLDEGFPSFFQPIMDSLVYNGKTWAIPLDVNTLTIGYNLAAFDSAQVDVPTSLDELIAIAEPLRGAGYEPLGVSAKDGWPMGDLWFAQVAYTDESGEAIRRAEQGEIGWDDDVFVEAAANVEKMVKGGLFAEGGSANDTATVVNQFASERFAMMYPVGNFLTDLIDQASGGEVSYDLFAFPSPDGSQEPVSTGGVAEMFSVPKNGENPEAAIELMRTFLSPEGLVELVSRNFIPATGDADTAVNDDPIYVKMTSFQENAQTRVIYTPEVYAALTNEMTALYSGDATPNDVVTAMSEAAN